MVQADRRDEFTPRALSGPAAVKQKNCTDLRIRSRAIPYRSNTCSLRHPRPRSGPVDVLVDGYLAKCSRVL